MDFDARQERQGLYRGPKTLSILPTFQCTAQCTSCGTFSSPYDKTTIGIEAIISAIDQAKALGFANVVFSGGEATIRWEMLLKGIEYAHSCGFPTRLVSNAYWARTPEAAEARMAKLVKAGLTEINYSTGDEHTRFVPIERVVNAVLASLSYDLPTNVMIELRAERAVTKHSLADHPRIKALPEEKLALLGYSESPWMPADPDTLEIYDEGVAVNRTNIAGRLGCDSILQTYVLQPDGRIGACCGLGLRILPELNVARSVEADFLERAVAEAESDFLKLWIHTHGPEKIIAWAAEKDPSIRWENMYAHRCQACLRLYKDPAIGKVVREHYSEMVAQVLQVHWLDSEYVVSKLGGGTAPSAAAGSVQPVAQMRPQAEDTDQDQIDRDEVVQRARDHQDQDSENQRHQGGDIDDVEHGQSPGKVSPR